MSIGESDAILSLSETARDDLAHLAKHRGKLGEIADATSELRLGIGLSDAARIVGEAVEIPPQEAARVFSTIQNLQRLKMRLSQDAAHLLRTLTATLETQTPEDWKKQNLDAWKQTIGPLTQLLNTVQDDHPLAVVRKAEQLGVEQQNLLMHARVLTDLRPVFNSAGDKIHESLVIQTLLIDYHDGTGPRRLALALDARDVAQLRALCERAEAKASALKAGLSDLPWPTSIVGESQAS